MDKNYLDIVKHYEECLERHGDTHKGVDWPNEKDAEKRYQVMLDVIRFSPAYKSNTEVQLLDFGCGASHLFEYMKKHDITNVNYSGLDISEKFIQLSRYKHPENMYYCVDILQTKEKLPIFDYIILNGVFTEKRGLTFEDMLSYFKEVIRKMKSSCRVGFAFNVMSKQVDWERTDLFHLPLDTLSNFLCKEVSRNFIIRNDYGLYEYTTYVYPGE